MKKHTPSNKDISNELAKTERMIKYLTPIIITTTGFIFLDTQTYLEKLGVALIALGIVASWHTRREVNP